ACAAGHGRVRRAERPDSMHEPRAMQPASGRALRDPPDRTSVVPLRRQRVPVGTSLERAGGGRSRRQVRRDGGRRGQRRAHGGGSGRAPGRPTGRPGPTPPRPPPPLPCPPTPPPPATPPP